MTRDSKTSLQYDNVEDIGKIRNSLMIEAGVTFKKLDNWKMIMCIYWIARKIFFNPHFYKTFWTMIEIWMKRSRRFFCWPLNYRKETKDFKWRKKYWKLYEELLMIYEKKTILVLILEETYVQIKNKNKFLESQLLRYESRKKLSANVRNCALSLKVLLGEKLLYF